MQTDGCEILIKLYGTQLRPCVDSCLQNVS